MGFNSAFKGLKDEFLKLEEFYPEIFKVRRVLS